MVTAYATRPPYAEEAAPPTSNGLSGTLRTFVCRRASRSCSWRDAPYDLVEELVARSHYCVTGREVFGPEPIIQSIDDYVTSLHSRNGLSRDRMSIVAASEFDQGLGFGIWDLEFGISI